MIQGYPYIGMLITGVMHLVLGISTTLICIIGGMQYVYQNYLAGSALLGSFWVILVGALGVAAGISSFKDSSTRRLKFAYMVTAILSASFFSWGASALLIANYVVWEEEIYSVYTPVQYIVGTILLQLEFILAIVSSSICCCCSGASTPGVMVVQQQPQIMQSYVMQQQQQQQQQQPYYGAPFTTNNQVTNVNETPIVYATEKH